MMFYNHKPTKFQNIIGYVSKNKVKVLILCVIAVYLFSFLAFNSTTINNLNNNNNNNNIKTKTFEKDSNNNNSNNNNNNNNNSNNNSNNSNNNNQQNNNIKYSNDDSNSINNQQQQQQQKHQENKIIINNNQVKNDKEFSQEVKEINKILQEKQEEHYKQMTLDSQQPVEYDTAIIVLGYSLHPDGMPTQILKERVVLAANYYNQLQVEGSSIKVILSGKSKSNSFDIDQGFNSEAEAMNEIALHNDVPPRDIMIEANSTNTAENAKFTLSFLEKNNIQRLFIVTSDFHILRSQYIFQTVFPSSYELIFVGSQTSTKTQTIMKDKEKVLFQSSKKDLEGLGIFGSNADNTFHPYRNLPRWRMIERELNLDKRELEDGSLIADYSANERYFTVQMSNRFPQAKVYSFEDESINEYNAESTATHEMNIRNETIKNNFSCKTSIQPSMLQMLTENQHVYEYQLSLSSFHWINAMNTREEFESTLINFLLGAHTTFIELPEAVKYKGIERQHAWDKINKYWYQGRSEEEILRDLKDKYDITGMTWKTLGAILHENKTVRKLIRVDIRANPDNRSALSHDTLALDIYNCKDNQIKLN